MKKVFTLLCALKMEMPCLQTKFCLVYNFIVKGKFLFQYSSNLFLCQIACSRLQCTKCLKKSSVTSL